MSSPTDTGKRGGGIGSVALYNVPGSRERSGLWDGIGRLDETGTFVPQAETGSFRTGLVYEDRKETERLTRGWSN